MKYESTKKLSYAEQLKHPNWQKVRLQELSASNFQCSSCGQSESNLHVHHKQYFKGRMAWEYESHELAVLCENCHASEHIHEEIIKRIFANSNSHFSILAGYNLQNDSLNPEDIESGFNNDPYDFMCGAIAHLATHLNLHNMYKVAEYAASLSKDDSEARMIFNHNKYIKKIGNSNGSL